MDDSYIYNDGNGVAVEIEVEYFDSSAGLFSINYDSIYGTAEAVEPIELKGTNTWKTHTFRFYDAKFANGYNGADFAVRTYNTKRKENDSNRQN